MWALYLALLQHFSEVCDDCIIYIFYILLISNNSTVLLYFMLYRTLSTCKYCVLSVYHVFVGFFFKFKLQVTLTQQMGQQKLLD